MIAWFIRRRRRFYWLAAVIVLMYITDIGPRWGPRASEVTEAKVMARSLKVLAPGALELIQKEHVIANELKITLEEAASVDPEEFRKKFNSYVDRLVDMRNKRREILASLRQGLWDSPMVFVVQHSALAQMKDEIARTETWIEFAMNIRLRSELGRKGEFPEMLKLNKQLTAYLLLPPEDPLNDQVQGLMEEFRFGEAELFQDK